MVIDDEKNILNSIRRMIHSKNDWDIEYFTDPNEALKRAETAVFELFISDYKMPSMDGVTFLSKAKKIQPRSQRIILSGYADLADVIRAINEANIYRFIAKPWHDFEFISAIEQALEYHRVLTENHFLSQLVEDKVPK